MFLGRGLCFTLLSPGYILLFSPACDLSLGLGTGVASGCLPEVWPGLLYILLLWTHSSLSTHEALYGILRWPRRDRILADVNFAAMTDIDCSPHSIISIGTGLLSSIFSKAVHIIASYKSQPSV